MINFELVNKLNETKEKIVLSKRTNYPTDDKMPSLDIWCLHNEFLCWVYNKYPRFDSQGLENKINTAILIEIASIDNGIDAHLERKEAIEILNEFCDALIQVFTK